MARPGRLESWKEIAAYFGRDVRTVQRWEKHEGLPVHRRLTSVYAHEAELEAWWNEGRPPVADALPAGRPRLAVLPLRNLSGDPAQDYFADGLTEEIVAQLCRVDPSRLAVLARSSVDRLLADGRSAPAIARELGAGYVLDGSVRRAGQRVRLSLQLVRAADQSHAWAASYDRDLRDILDVQSELARAVTTEITARVVPAGAARPVDPETYNAHLMGRHLWNRRTVEDVRRAIEQFERAVARTPGYAPSHAGLADCYAVLANVEVGAMAPVEAMPRAKAAAEQALALDPTLGEAHASRGFVHLWFEWDWPAAEADFRRAIELCPDHASARQWHAAYLQTVGAGAEAVTEVRRGLELDPLSSVLRVELSSIHYFERDFERSARQAREILDLDPGYLLATFNLARALVQQGRAGDALRELQRSAARAEELPGLTMALGMAHAAAGRKGEAQRAIEALARLGRRRYVSPFCTAAIYALLGGREETVRWLTRAREERCGYFVHLAHEPVADRFRADPAFRALLPVPGPAARPAARVSPRGA